ncbi:chemotaxis protein methyltransferase CheR [Gottschalkia acidurici 9a]|uniref:protein-glutamate O-methyltransferase n=1 Tax=Gottschalkia acidurici (strain ATCC 7906 / DSM 604 / BCRC 14475 / CIP 104303 / KCTC 5404 / NCIMB 10678 / 9a) TaxID=1128398 RepID=K0AZ08_GOTA9|nr:protein-glutamate O-methyltransferase CheR [Gottschalkia acidurici]AFS77915.1 chemotaxis protein methyltransferase CheR [Gottschalkia acidurici 9a]
MIKMTDIEFQRIIEYVHLNFGIDLAQKRSLIHNRMQNYLVQNDFESFTEFYNYMISDKTGIAVSLLIDKLTTNHTFFFRESEHFEFLKNTVLPYIKEYEKTSKDLRIWSAGCSSGEEPYTIAMFIDEYFDKEGFLWNTKILATDICEKTLNKGKVGIYDSQSLFNVSPYWTNKYFTKIDSDRYMINNNIKDEVIFRRFNLMNNIFPFKKKFHAIFCRNVMIYFDEKTKKELIDKFYEMTEEGGYLFIGHSETINKNDTKYKYVLPSVYRKE